MTNAEEHDKAKEFGKAREFGKATYHAPPGESKVLEWLNHTFLDGVATPITDAALAEAIEKNACFEYVAPGGSLPKQETTEISEGGKKR